NEPPPYRNPFFRRGLLLALLNDRQWYEPMATALAERPAPFFVQSSESPRNLSWFWQDARTKFEAIATEHQEALERMKMSTPTDAKAARPETPLPLLVHRLVQAYVLRKTEEKSGHKWEDFKNKKTDDGRIAVPSEYREAKDKIASGIFLEMRSRREQ